MKPREPSVLRRQLLVAAPAALAAAIFRVAKQESGTETDRRLLAVLGLDPDHVRERMPMVMQRDLLRAADGIQGVPDDLIAALTDGDLRKLVRNRIREDYAIGRIADVCGWRLSHTEIHCLGRAVLRG